MEFIKLTKTKADNMIIGSISRLLKASTYVLLKGNCLHCIIEDDDIGSNLKKNGTTIVKSFIDIDMPDGIIMRTVYGLDETISDIRKKVKASSEIFLGYDTHSIGLNLDGVYVGLFIECSGDIFTNKRNDYTTALCDIMDKTIELNDGEKINIANSKVVEISVDGNRVRLSKNCLPLLGPVRADSMPKFKAWYNIKDLGLDDGTGVLCLHVDYGNGTDAIHLYSVIFY